MANIWLQFLGHLGIPIRNAIFQALSGAGLESRELGREKAESPGLVFFDEVTPSLFVHLRDVSRSGLVRVLAVAVRGDHVSRRDAWALLQAGVSDLFAWDRMSEPAAMVAARVERWAAVDQLLGTPLIQNHLVGRSPAWISVLRQIVEVARFTDAAVLITVNDYFIGNPIAHCPQVVLPIGIDRSFRGAGEERRIERNCFRSCESTPKRHWTKIDHPLYSLSVK